jgi:hypothetical protein
MCHTSTPLHFYLGDHMQIFGAIKQWVTWKITGPKIERFIHLNCNALMEEFPDLEYLEFKYKDKKFRFAQAVKQSVQ